MILMKKYAAIFGGIIIAASLIFIIFFKSTNKNYTLDSVYSNDVYVEYQVKYPSELKVEAESENPDHPDIALYIYLNEDTRLSIYAATYQIDPLAEGRDMYDFVTDSGLKGKIYELKKDGEIYLNLTFDDVLIGAALQGYPLDEYEKNKDLIFSILKSIQVP